MPRPHGLHGTTADLSHKDTLFGANAPAHALTIASTHGMKPPTIRPELEEVARFCRTLEARTSECA